MGIGQPKPLTTEQALHVNTRTHQFVVYLMKVESDLLKKGHDERHPYFRKVRKALLVCRGLESASYTVSRVSEFCVPEGSLHESHGLDY